MGKVLFLTPVRHICGFVDLFAKSKFVLEFQEDVETNQLLYDPDVIAVFTNPNKSKILRQSSPSATTMETNPFHEYPVTVIIHVQLDKRHRHLSNQARYLRSSAVA